MKYLIGGKIINADHIIEAEYFPSHPYATDPEKMHPPHCCITTAALDEASEPNCPKNEVVTLHADEADRFWNAYSSDAYHVV